MKLRLCSQYTGHPRHENNTGYRAHFCSRAISVTEQSFVSSFEALHIGQALCYTFVQCKQVIELWMNKQERGMESARNRSENSGARTRIQFTFPRLRAVSLSSWSARDTKMTTRVTEGARREMHELFLWLTASDRRKLIPGRSMGVFSGHDFNWLNLLFKRHGKCQDVYYQFCNTHFSFCLYSSCQRRQFENPCCFK